MGPIAEVGRFIEGLPPRGQAVKPFFSRSGLTGESKNSLPQLTPTDLLIIV